MLKINIMKKIISILILLFSTFVFSQTNGITYQAVLYNSAGESVPGVNTSSLPLSNKSVCLQFSFFNAATQLEYQETIKIKTDAFGMVNLVIGTGTKSGGFANSFSVIVWNNALKSLKISLDTSGNCNSFEEISNQALTYVPFALAANSATSVSGVVGVTNGGTGANTIVGAKTNLGLQNVDNTYDVNKPVSIATQTALNLKENATNKSIDGALATNSDVKFPTEKAVKTYVDGNITSVNANTTALQSTVTANELIATNANVVLQTAVNTNATATTTALALKENAANKSIDGTLATNSDVKFPTEKAVKAYVDGSITLVNANTTALQATVTANELISTNANAALQTTINTNATAATTALVLKENAANKSIDGALATNSDVKFPTEKAVKTYVDGNITAVNANTTALQATVTANELIATNANVALQTAVNTNATATTTALALKENAANKSIDGTLATNSDVKFPTEKAVKTYVDGSITLVNANTTALQATVTANELIATNANVALQTAVNTNATATTTALVLKENAANKSIDGTLATNSDVKFPTEKAVKTYVDTNIAAGTATNVSGIVVIANGGTGSSTKNFVDITTAQNIAGVKTFGSDAIVNGLTVGRGAGNIDSNTANGISALQTNTTGISNTANGAGALEKNSTGNNNTANGAGSLNNNTLGSDNTANGDAALYNNTTGMDNTASGRGSLFRNSSGSDNTAIGKSALYENITGKDNTAVGSNSLNRNTTGNDNTANGIWALYFNTTGSKNTANGSGALSQNTIGANNTSIGFRSLFSNTVGYSNTANGFHSLFSNVSGYENTGGGMEALYSNTTGFQNTATGFYALASNTTGSQNTAIGYGANVFTGNLTNATAIGNAATVNASNTIQLGNTAVTNVRTSGTVTAGDVTYPNAHNGTGGQVLTVDASGSATFATAVGTHFIGESYGGGIVFYVYDNGQHGLIVAIDDQDRGIEWNNTNFRFTGTTGDGFGAGSMNTAIIVASQMEDNPRGNFAAKVCADYQVFERNGISYGDWYLPSIWELTELYRQKRGLRSFGAHVYWSSTEFDDRFAYSMNFGDGSNDKEDKSLPYAVRAIRAF
jgi:hypothetical protein